MRTSMHIRKWIPYTTVDVDIQAVIRASATRVHGGVERFLSGTPVKRHSTCLSRPHAVVGTLLQTETSHPSRARAILLVFSPPLPQPSPTQTCLYIWYRHGAGLTDVPVSASVSDDHNKCRYLSHGGAEPRSCSVLLIIMKT